MRPLFQTCCFPDPTIKFLSMASGLAIGPVNSLVRFGITSYSPGSGYGVILTAGIFPEASARIRADSNNSFGGN